MDVLPMALSMFFLGFSRMSFHMDGKVIHIHQEPSLHHLLPEYSVHHHLKGGRGVREAEEQDRRFEEPFGSEEGCFPFVSWFYAYIVIPPSYVKFGEQHAPT